VPARCPSVQFSSVQFSSVKLLPTPMQIQKDKKAPRFFRQ
jgi:hypothetical protein